MTKLHGKSVLLGMGIGTILTALLGFIFFLGYQPEMDEAKIRELAYQYGMVDPGAMGSITVTIMKDDTLLDVTEKLASVGLIKQEDMVSFQIRLASLKAKEKKDIIPGTYEFQGNEGQEEIIGILLSPGNTSP
ncbi:MAG: hypothetical protein GX144_03880 [Clostridiaceae bacterium]|jgi:cell division protein YceG involved in septum cleavage|nr:hypothetical protein [Clostridiaceae bacterium]